MADEATLVVLDLCEVLLGDGGTDRGLMSLIIDGYHHTPGCPRGQWLQQGSPRPAGDPCSDRCVRARAAISRAAAWLQAHEDDEADLDRQVPLLEGIAS